MRPRVLLLNPVTITGGGCGGLGSRGTCGVGFGVGFGFGASFGFGAGFGASCFLAAGFFVVGSGARRLGPVLSSEMGVH